MKNDRENIKCVLVGNPDDYPERKYLLMSYIDGCYPGENVIPEPFDDLRKDLIIDNKPIHLILWDIVDPRYADDRFWPLGYVNTDVIILIFSVTSPNSFERTRSVFYPQINHHAPGVPFILAGIHLEGREDIARQREFQSQGLSMVTKEMGQKLAKDIGAQQYLECSALTQEGLSEVFETAIRIGLASNKAKKAEKAKKAKHHSLFKWPDFFGKQRKDKDHGPSGKNQPKNIASKPR